MAKIKEDIEDIHENSLDNRSDGEYMNLIKDNSLKFVINEEKPQLVPQNFLDSSDNDSLNYKEITNQVTYKLIPMGGDETTVNMPSSPAHEPTFYVISNPVEVFTNPTTTAKKTFKREPVQNNKAVTAKKRDDKRRATHNEVERRRRDKINNWIMKLAALVPNSGLPDSASKGGILAKACDHITELTEKQKRLEKLEVENEKLVLEVLRLNQELTDLRKDNSSMRHQLADNCIVFNHRQKGQKS